MLVRSDGADLVDDPRDATTLTFSEDGARAALEEILDVLREPRLTPTPQQLEKSDALTRFAEGRLGMLFATRAVVPELSEAGVEFDVLPLPRLGRARTADTLVLAARPPGRADLALDSTTLAWEGLHHGSGRLRRRRLAVTATGRGIAGHREVEVLLPEVGGMIAATPPRRSATSPRTRVDLAPLPARPPLSIRRAG